MAFWLKFRLNFLKTHKSVILYDPSKELQDFNFFEKNSRVN